MKRDRRSVGSKKQSWNKYSYPSGIWTAPLQRLFLATVGALDEVERAKAFIREGKLEEACLACIRALEEVPGEPHISLLVGRIFFQLGRLRDCLPHLENARPVAESQPEYYYMLGFAHYRLEQYEPAIR